MEFDFSPGYWSWIVSIDGTPFYTFGDLSEEIADVRTLHGFHIVADILVYNMISFIQQTIDFPEDFEDLDPYDPEAFEYIKAHSQELVHRIATRLYVAYGEE